MAKKTSTTKTDPPGPRKRKNPFQISGYSSAAEDLQRAYWSEHADFRRGVTALGCLLFDSDLTPEEVRRMDNQVQIDGRWIEQQDNAAQQKGAISYEGLMRRLLHALGREAIERLLKLSEEKDTHK